MKRIFPPTLMATRKDFGFACVCALAGCSLASRAMTSAARGCCASRSTGQRLERSGPETACPAGPIFIVFIVVSYITGAGVPSDHLPTGTKKTVSGSEIRRRSSPTAESSATRRPSGQISTKSPHALVLNSFSFIDLPLRTRQSTTHIPTGCM